MIDSFDAALVVDMQNSFLDPGGGTYDITGAPMVRIPETIEGNRTLVEAARASGVPLVFTRQVYRRGYVDAGAITRARYDLASEAALVEGTWDIEVIDALGVTDADLVVDKPRMDAFHNTSLEVLLAGLGARRLLVSGVVTNACVETTTRSAAMRDFEVTVVSDCCTTLTEADQQASLSSLERFGFATVSDLTTVLGR